LIDLCDFVQSDQRGMKTVDTGIQQCMQVAPDTLVNYCMKSKFAEKKRFLLTRHLLLLQPITLAIYSIVLILNEVDVNE